MEQLNRGQKAPTWGDSLVSCLAALYLQYGPVLSQVLCGDRTFTPDIFQHYNIVMPSDSVGPGPQYRQACHPRWTDKAVQMEPVWGQSTARKMGSSRMALGAQGASTEQGMRAAEAAWQQCLHPPCQHLLYTATSSVSPGLGDLCCGVQQLSLPWALISVAPASGLGLPYPSFPDQSPDGCTAASHRARVCGCGKFELL